MNSDLDPHGQPLNVQFNRARRTERDICEFLGLAKGLLADGVVSADEADMVRDWVEAHPDVHEVWPINAVVRRVRQVYQDGYIDPTEQKDLAALLTAVVGGNAGMIVGHDAPTDLPLDHPQPVLQWTGYVFVFTGQFAYGTRRDCEREVQHRGGICEKSVTVRTRYLVVGTFGSRDWAHTSFGRKIQKAVQYRDSKRVPIAIVGEDHWATSLPA
jgi:NAD-dependent DNA ligase